MPALRLNPRPFHAAFSGQPPELSTRGAPLAPAREIWSGRSDRIDDIQLGKLTLNGQPW
jgi:hypothetical protein